MIDFIWHLRGSIAVAADLNSDVITERIEQLLKKQRKDVTEREDESISFYTPFWSSMFGPNWLVMGIYEQGRFWIEETRTGRQLRFDLRSLHGLIFCLCAAALSFAITIFGNGLVVALEFAVLALSWLYGMNLLSAWIQVPPAIRQAIRRS